MTMSDSFPDNKIQIRVPIPKDSDGFTGRECPNKDCLGYFKVQFGTGLKGEDLPCHCPYCGHVGPHNTFFTPEQIEYGQSVAVNQLTGQILKEFKKLEFTSRPMGGFGLSVSMKISGQSHPIRYYREKQLETEIVCEKCTLRYAVYGVFAFCPDCGQHNSRQIFDKSMELVLKMLDMSATAEQGISIHLVENALEDCVSAFDGFGREIGRVYADKSSNPVKARKLSFQNLDGAKQNIQELFGLDISSHLSNDEWIDARKDFQKRHLLSHKMGIIDEDYVKKTADKDAVIGRKIAVTSDEVCNLVMILSKLATSMAAAFVK